MVVHRDVWLSDATVFDVLDSDHLPVFFRIMDHVSSRNISAAVETDTDWKRFRSLASELISPQIQTCTIEEAEKAASNFTSSVTSAYRLSTRILTLSDLKNELPGLDHLL
jgi:hypothetical protein